MEIEVAKKKSALVAQYHFYERVVVGLSSAIDRREPVAGMLIMTGGERFDMPYSAMVDCRREYQKLMDFTKSEIEKL